MKKENFYQIFGEVSRSKIEDLEKRILKLGIDLKDIEEHFIKGSGKGGQKRNKSSNKVVLVYKPLGIVSKCGSYRSLSINRFFALRSLIEKIEKTDQKFLKRRSFMKILDGKVIAEEIHLDTLNRVSYFSQKKGRKPFLAIVNYYDDSPSAYYMNLKVKKCKSLGIDVKIYKPEINKKSFIDLIKKLGEDENVDAIMVEKPLPEGFDDKEFWDVLNPSKDVDALSSINMGRLFITREFSDIKNYSFFVPQTAYACIKILEYYGIDVEGKKVCVVGRSSVVGKPLSIMLSLMNATVTLCHSKTNDLQFHLKNSDIIFVAIGKAKFIKGDMIGENQIIIDIGTNIGEDGKLVGDVDFDSVKDKVAAITPVPGGVGPVTLACLLNATVRAAQNGII